MLLAALAFYRWVGLRSGNLVLTLGLGPARCVAGFVPGMLVFLRRGLIAGTPDWGLSVLQLGAIAAVVAVLAIPLADPLVIPAFVVLVAATCDDRGIVPRVLGARPLQRLGELSYSVYLNHLCLNVLVGFAWGRTVAHLVGYGTGGRLAWIGCYFAVILLVSRFTFERVERPARDWLSRRWTGHRAPPISTAPAVP